MIRISCAVALGCAALLALAHPTYAQMAPDWQPQTEDEKTLYAIGLVLASNMTELSLTPDEMSIVSEGLRDGVSGGEPKVDPAAQTSQIQAFMTQRAAAAATQEKQESAAFLESMAAEDGAERTSSGLIFFELEEGDGASPGSADNVTVHYHGTLRDGTVFDSSVDRGETATFQLNRVIPCWTEGVQMMKAGGKARLVCPSDIAYGDRGSPPRIKPGAVLVFEVELIAVN